MTPSPHLLLTRPRPQAERFAAMVTAACPLLGVTISPLIEIAHLRLAPGAGDGAAGLVFTSENGVAAFAAGCARRDVPAWCVGPRTAQAARAAGFMRVIQGGGDAAALLDRLTQERPAGPLLHLRGRHAAADIAAALRTAGVDARDLVVYEQRARLLSDAARAILARPGDVVVPLFSSRTARLFAAGLRDLRCAATLHPVAISAAVAQVSQLGHRHGTPVAASPDADAMARAVVACIRTLEASGNPR